MSNAIKRCPQCGAPCIYTDAFCVSCGAKFELREGAGVRNTGALPVDDGTRREPKMPDMGQGQQAIHERHRAHTAALTKKKRPRGGVMRSFLLVVAALLVIGGFYALYGNGAGQGRENPVSEPDISWGVPAALPAFMLPVQQQTDVPEGFISISSKADLIAINNDLTASYILMNDIDLDCGPGNEWVPIGAIPERYYTTLTDYGGFAGIFEGNGYSISGLYIALPELQQSQVAAAGLFAMVQDGTVQNLAVQGEVVLQGQHGQYTYAGGIAGVQLAFGGDTTIRNCAFTGKVGGAKYCGGIVGLQMANAQQAVAGIVYCANGGAVSGGMAGGIAGCQMADTNCNAAVEHCHNAGPVQAPSGASNEGGGMVGLVQATGANSNARISYCANTAEITGAGHTGGIAGGAVAVSGEQERASIVIEFCYNTHAISSKRYAGGILGHSYAETQGDAVALGDCLNTGVVQGARRSTAPITPKGRKEQEKAARVQDCFYTEGAGGRDPFATRASAQDMAEKLAALQQQIV